MAKKAAQRSAPANVVFPFDVDNALLGNDKVIGDLRIHLQSKVGTERARCYWRIFERLRTRLGHADYLGAQRARGAR
jgi:hypothetical protein